MTSNNQRTWRNPAFRKRLSERISAAHRRQHRIDESTARLIASAIHEGHGSALERFGAGHALDVYGAVDEMGAIPRDVPLHWVRALDRYFDERIAELEEAEWDALTGVGGGAIGGHRDA